MNYGYIRVSTDKQTVENQRFEILQFCQHEGIKIDGWIEETVSGGKAPDKRKLGLLLKKSPERRYDYLFRAKSSRQVSLHGSQYPVSLYGKRSCSSLY